MATYVQYGAGFCGPTGWINFDSSPSLRLERLPVVGRFLRKNAAEFPKNVRYGNIIRGLPLKAGSVDCIYASHVLEHLSREDFDVALDNTFAALKPGGIFRLVVPDLEARVRLYLAKVDSADSTASDFLMRSTYLGKIHRPRGPLELITSLFGGSAHLWMWDFPSMKGALASHGFEGIRRCNKGDSNDVMLDLVEDEHRFVERKLQIPELSIHCKKPL